MKSQNLSDVGGANNGGPYDHVEEAALQCGPHAQEYEGDGHEGIVVQTGVCGGASRQEGQVEDQ